MGRMVGRMDHARHSAGRSMMGKNQQLVMSSISHIYEQSTEQRTEQRTEHGVQMKQMKQMRHRVQNRVQSSGEGVGERSGPGGARG